MWSSLFSWEVFDYTQSMILQMGEIVLSPNSTHKAGLSGQKDAQANWAVIGFQTDKCSLIDLLLSCTWNLCAQVEEVGPEKKKRKVKEVTPEWDLLNKQKPIW